MKRLFLVLLVVQFSVSIYSQTTTVDGRSSTGLNTITTAVPFLLIGPDPVSAGMGECGVATGNDVYSMHWNPAKYAYKDDAYESSENSLGQGIKVGLFYSPWLRALVNDINFGGVYVSQRLNEKSAISGSFRAFSLGDIVFTNIQGTVVGNYRPFEWTADVAWSQKLTEHWYGAVAGRLIFSKLTNGQFVAGMETKPGSSVAADLAVYYRNTVPLFASDGELSFGMNISNIGSKINYTRLTDMADFIPTNLRVGTSYQFILPYNQKFRLSVDFNKLLVPTPPLYKFDSTGNVVFDENNEPIIERGMSPDVSVLHGMIQSFYDAPDGFREELNEITIGVGAEYMLYNIVSLRGGYFYENKTKGNRKFVTLGLGVHYKFIGANFSYLIAEQMNPLGNTWRLGLSVAI